MLFSTLEGKVLVSITGAEKDSCEILLTDSAGQRYRLYHEQDCCEVVSVEEIIGDIEDLLNTEILSAREETNVDQPRKPHSEESWTWTFYIIQTIKGSVTIRWYGSSNGYYSESVTFTEIKR